MDKTIIKIYLSGKITGVANDNLPKFRAAAEFIQFQHRPVYKAINGKAPDFDCHVFVPHDLPATHNKGWHEYMRECLKCLCQCEVMYVLDDWKRSRGALVEVFVAKVLQIPIIEVETLNDLKITWTQLLAKILVRI